MNNLEDKGERLLTESELIDRWQMQEQHPKFLYRLRTSKSKKQKLKSVKIGNQVRFRLSDVQDWEERNAKHFLSSVAETDTANWSELARLVFDDEKD